MNGNRVAEVRQAELQCMQNMFDELDKAQQALQESEVMSSTTDVYCASQAVDPRGYNTTLARTNDCAEDLARPQVDFSTIDSQPGLPQSDPNLLFANLPSDFLGLSSESLLSVDHQIDNSDDLFMDYVIDRWN